MIRREFFQDLALWLQSLHSNFVMSLSTKKFSRRYDLRFPCETPPTYRRLLSGSGR
jgi:hypothetical protein